MAKYKLVQVRSDGVVYESEFWGYQAEQAMIAYRKDARMDKRTVATLVFEWSDGKYYVPYTTELASEFQTGKN